MSKASGIAERLVAHRGWPDRYPENSLEGIRAVLAAGARWVEFDVQITADRQPVVVHDNDLNRLAGRNLRVTETPLAQLNGLQDRDGHPFRISTLSQVLSAFDERPEATAFVELKSHSIVRFGRRAAVDIVLEAMSRLRNRCVFLSFDRRACALARRSGADAVGWVFRSWSPWTRLQAMRLKPDYLFVRADRVPDRSHPFWPGRWQWVVYGVDHLENVRRWIRHGAALVEVDDLPGLIAADTNRANKSPPAEQL